MEFTQKITTDGFLMLMAIDPGGKSGIAIRLPNGDFVTCICESIFVDEKGKRYFDATQLYDMLKTDGITHVVVETFQATTIDKHGLHTVRLVGAIEAICYYRGIPLTKHMPQDRYPFKLEAKQLLIEKKTKYLVHEFDALSHLLRYEYDNR